MIDAFLLTPYWCSLKIRHRLFDKGVRKSSPTEVPSICIGNITVGGTGKTPHTEMIVNALLENLGYRSSEIAVLSRGYKRQSKGFQQVTLDGSAALYGDEPLQIKKKFPGITVAVDKDRNHGAKLLCNPDLVGADRKSRRCINKEVEQAGIIVLDDAMQYRSLRPDVTIVLVDYNRPTFEDHLMPLGSLRDLPQRIKAADIVIVTKCPAYMEDEEKEYWKNKLGVDENQELFFTRTGYCPMEPVFPEGEPRYLYSKRLVLFTGIANDKPLQQQLSDNYKVVRHLKYPDHHKFSPADIREIRNAAEAYPTAVVATTEKDSQRVKDCKNTPETLKQRMFRVPIEVVFIGEDEKSRFISVLKKLLQGCRSESEQMPRE